MSLICFTCGKRAQHGNLVSHAKNRTKRRFGVNLHTRWVTVKGKRVRAKFCAKCIKRRKKTAAVSRTPQIPILV